LAFDFKANYGFAWSFVHKLAVHLCKNLIEQHKILLYSSTEKADSDMETIVFESIYNHKFNFNTTFNVYSNREKTISNLNEIEKLLSFVLTYCDSNLIEEILYQKLKIENATHNLETFDEKYEYGNADENDNFLKFDQLLIQNKIDFEEENFVKKNNEIKHLLKVLLKLKKDNFKNASALIQSLNRLTSLDSDMTMGFLLEINDVNLNVLEDSFKFQSPISYEFLLYLFSLNLINRVHQDDKVLHNYLNEKFYFFFLKFSTLIHTIQTADEIPYLDEQSVTNSFKQFKKINTLYTEFNQNNTLEQLKLGIDLKRFETDQQYKSETILGLSMDIKTFQLACSLARFYSLDIWKVYMSFTEYILIEHESVGIDLESVEKKISPLLSVLKSKKNEFESIMDKNVLPLIDGKELQKLLVFYSLLGDEFGNLHVKTLKKLISLNLESLNYKKLLENPLECIDEYLDDGNLKVFEKLLPKLPVKNLNIPLDVSKLHVVWCLKKFWHQIDKITSEREEFEDDDEQFWNVEKQSQFFYNFDGLNESMKKLNVETDFIYFFKELTLNKKSCDLLNIQIRKEILKKATKFLKNSQKQLNENIENKINSELHQIQNHLKQMENMQKFMGKIDQNHQKELKNLNHSYLKRFDKDLSDILRQNLDLKIEDHDLKLKTYQDILVSMLFDAYSFEALHDLIKLLELNDSLSIKELIKLALNKICLSLKETKQNKASQETYLAKLQILLDSISNYLNKDVTENTLSAKDESKKTKKSKDARLEKNPAQSIKIINDEDVMDCMRFFCNDQHIDIKVRLFILEELRKSLKNIKDEDLMILLVYKTNAILTSCNQFGQKVDLINSSEIENEPQRKKLINKLIDLSTTFDHCAALISLLKSWPEFTETEKTNEKPWNNVLIKLIAGNHSIIETANELKEKNALNESDLDFIQSELRSNENWSKKDSLLKISFIKLSLIYKNFKRVKVFIENTDLECFNLINIVNPNDFENDQSLVLVLNDKELMDLMLQEKSYLQLINTPLYSIFFYYIARNESKATINEIIKGLKQNGHFVEAAKLFAEVENVNDSHKTLTTSLLFLEKYFGKF
jgi:neuroblastoma-amplified sequence